MQPHQCRAQGAEHCPGPAGHTVSSTSQDAVGRLGHLGTLLAPVQWLLTSTPRPFPPGSFPAALPQPVALCGVAVTPAQDPALSLVTPHTVGISPSVQPAQSPLQSLPALQQINTPTQLGVI